MKSLIICQKKQKNQCKKNLIKLKSFEKAKNKRIFDNTMRFNKVI